MRCNLGAMSCYRFSEIVVDFRCLLNRSAHLAEIKHCRGYSGFSVILDRLSLPGLTRQSILFARRWMRGSSPRMTVEKSVQFERRFHDKVTADDGAKSRKLPDRIPHTRTREWPVALFNSGRVHTMRNFAKGRTLMKAFIAALTFATLIAGTAFVTSADAARRSAPNYYQTRVRRDSGGSWQCYPYCEGGTYEGRPVSEWMKPDRW